MPGVAFREILKAASDVLVANHGYRKRGQCFFRTEPGLLLNVWFQKIPVVQHLGFTINVGIGSDVIAHGLEDDSWSSKSLHDRHHLNFRIGNLMHLRDDRVYLYASDSVPTGMLTQLKADLERFVVPFHAGFRSKHDVLEKLKADGCGLSPGQRDQYIRILSEA